MNNGTLLWWTLLNSLVGITALIWNPGFKSPVYMMLCILVVAFLVLGPFIPFAFGWRIGERVPFDKSRVRLLIAVLLVTLLLLSPFALTVEERFGGYLMYIYMMPLIIIVGIAVAVGWIGLIAGIILALGYLYIVAYLLIKHDYYLVRKPKAAAAPDEDESNQSF